jgi:very-short-patch-repair endonuclease
VSGRLGCVSAAVHHGLWTLDDGRIHLAVAHGSSRFDAGDAIVHWSAGPIAPHRYELVEPLVSALVHIADCRPLDHALATWESAIRAGHVTPEALGRLSLRSAAAKRVRRGASALSDSGIETIPANRLRRVDIPVRQQVVIDGHPVDGLIGERLVYQIDGYEFHRSAERRRRDIAQDRRLTLMGYTVFRFDYKQVLFEWEVVESEVRHAVAMGLHLARSS